MRPATAPLVGVAPARREDLLRACQEFEGLFLSMLLREMQATVPRTGLLPLGAAGDIYRTLWAQEVGRAAARSSPLGISGLAMQALAPDSDPIPTDR